MIANLAPQRIGERIFGMRGALTLLSSCLLQLALTQSIGAISLVAEYVPGHGQPRATAMASDASPVTFSYYYDHRLGTWEQRPGGPCNSDENNSSYLKMGISGGEITAGTAQFSWDPAPFPLSADLIAFLNAGGLSIIKTDETLWNTDSCEDFTPPVAWVAIGEQAWFDVTFELADGSTEQRHLNLTRLPLLNNGPHDDSAQVVTATTAPLDLTMNDPNGGRVHPSSPVVVSTPGAVIERFSNCCVEYTPPPGFIGQDTFTYRGVRPNNSTYEAQVVVEVLAPRTLNACNENGIRTSEQFRNLVEKIEDGRRLITLLPAALDNFAPAFCDYKSYYNGTFNDWNQGSQNHIVKAAAVGLRWAPSEQVGPRTPIQWWKDFLANQTGQADDASLPPYLRSKGGSELTSPTYEWAVAAAVTSVHYWARRVRDEPTGEFARIEALARRFLRQTAIMYALAAGHGAAQEIHSHFPPVHGPDPNFDGDYVALAGMRAKFVNLTTWQKRGYYLARALGNEIEERLGSNSRHAFDLYTRVDELWGQNADSSRNQFGLSASERLTINNAIESGPTGDFIALATSVLGNVKTSSPLHYLAWGNGVRASLMERSLNGNTVGAHGAVFYRNGPHTGGPEASLLYAYDPERDDSNVPIANNYGAIRDLGNETVLEASHGLTANAPVIRIDGLPSLASAQYHVTLTRQAPPDFVTSLGPQDLIARRTNSFSLYLGGDLVALETLPDKIIRLAVPADGTLDLVDVSVVPADPEAAYGVRFETVDGSIQLNSKAVTVEPLPSYGTHAHVQLRKTDPIFGSGSTKLGGSKAKPLGRLNVYASGDPAPIFQVEFYPAE